jgi:hypothetical protein
MLGQCEEVITQINTADRRARKSGFRQCAEAVVPEVKVLEVG